MRLNGEISAVETMRVGLNRYSLFAALPGSIGPELGWVSLNNVYHFFIASCYVQPTSPALKGKKKNWSKAFKFKKKKKKCLLDSCIYLVLILI